MDLGEADVIMTPPRIFLLGTQLYNALVSVDFPSTIDRTLRGLVEEGRIMRCRQGVYALPGKCPGSEKITKYAGEEEQQQQQSATNQGVQGNGDRGGGS